MTLQIGLWSTCLDLPRGTHRHVAASLPWLGPRCVAHHHQNLGHGRSSSSHPQWFKVVKIFLCQML